MTASLSAPTIALVKATVPALEAHGLDITRRMYERLFQVEAMRALFNQSHQDGAGSQPKALANALMAYARNIENLGVLGQAVERIVQKHVALNIRPEHYPFVADALLGAIRDVLGEAATDEVMAAWGEAYWFLAELLIGREAAIYREVAARPGGWNGWRAFVIDSVVDESSQVRSFTLVPQDGAPVVPHRPGQYLGFAFDIPGVGSFRRNYSISCAPNGESYRITVKREDGEGGVPGKVSRWLHAAAGPGTVLQVAPPAGDFFLDEAALTPVVLVSAGVGLTPMVSMLEAIARAPADRPTAWVHGAANGRMHAMRQHVGKLLERIPAATRATFYARPDQADRPGQDYDIHGRISADWLVRNTAFATATYYLCGPRDFLRSLAGGLADAGLPAARLRYEFFGPAEEIMQRPAGALAAA